MVQGHLFRRKNLPFRRIILRNRKLELPHLAAKIRKVGSSMGQGAGYIRKHRSIKYWMSTYNRRNFQVMCQIGRDTIIGIIYDFQRGGSYLTNSKAQGTKLVDHIPLLALKTISLHFREQVHTVRDCPSDLFEAFVMQYTDVENITNWDDIFMRWRVINFLVDDGALEVVDTILVELPEVATWAQEGA